MPKGLKRGGIPAGQKVMWKCPVCDIEKQINSNNQKLMNKLMKLHLTKNHPEIQFEIINTCMAMGVNNDITNGKINGSAIEEMREVHRMMTDYNKDMIKKQTS